MPAWGGEMRSIAAAVVLTPLPSARRMLARSVMVARVLTTKRVGGATACNSLEP